MCGGGKGPLIQRDASATLSTLQDQTLFEPILLESNQNHATVSQTGVCTTLSAGMGMGGGWIPMVTEPAKTFGVFCKGNGDAFLTQERHASLTCGGGQPGQGYPAICIDQQGAVCIGNGQANQSIGGVVGALNCMHDQQAVLIPINGTQAP